MEDQTKLINLVRQQPAIWDKTSRSYKDKIAKHEAWRAVCAALDDKEQDTYNYVETVRKKWTHIRDTWIRSMRKLGDRTKIGRKYIYHKDLAFMTKIFYLDKKRVTCPHSDNGASTSPTMVSNISEESTANVAINTTKRKISEDFGKVVTEELEERRPKARTAARAGPAMCAVYDRVTEARERNNTRNNYDDGENNRHLLFFKSILPSLASFDDEQTLDFQAHVLTLLQSIKRSKSVAGSETATELPTTAKEDPLSASSPKMSPQSYHSYEF